MVVTDAIEERSHGDDALLESRGVVVFEKVEGYNKMLNAER
jgi:hypothetical protein